MFVPIGNTPRPYAWGSNSAIAELFGTEPSGRPEAELWLGAHSGSPSVILDPSLTGGATDLETWIAADPETALGPFAGSGRLPFLLKVLAAASPLSLQAHPTPEQAIEGFARENAAGIPLDAPERNYRDPFPKPELIYALSPTFDALCGFRTIESARELVRAFLAAAGSPEQSDAIASLLASLETPDALRTTVAWLLSEQPTVEPVVSAVSALASSIVGWELERDTVRVLAVEYPGDPGIVISLLLNRVRLSAGEALYLPAGNIHAYLDGFGVELMTASDNVLRGGLTPKHIDVPELLAVLDFRSVPVPYLHPTTLADDVLLFRPAGPGFELIRVTGAAEVTAAGPAIALCTAGAFSLTDGATTHRIGRGQSAYITPDSARFEVDGRGTLFVATTASAA